MSQSKLSKLLKLCIVIIGAMGLAFYCYILPFRELGMPPGSAKDGNVLWIIFILMTAPPVYAGLVIFWRICSDIQRDRSFTRLNAARMKTISELAMIDVVYHFTGNIILTVLDMNKHGSMMPSLFLDLIGICVAIAAAVLSHLVTKAAILKEDSDLTI